MALVGRPQLLFLDEPTVGLDVQARQMLWTTVRGWWRRPAIVLTTHYLEEAEALADRVVVLAHGRTSPPARWTKCARWWCASASAAPPRWPPKQSAAWPDVDSVNRDQRRLHITASDAEDVVRRLLAADAHLQSWKSAAQASPKRSPNSRRRLPQ